MKVRVKLYHGMFANRVATRHAKRYVRFLQFHGFTLHYHDYSFFGEEWQLSRGRESRYISQWRNQVEVHWRS